jgi:hypothetical protein
MPVPLVLAGLVLLSDLGDLRAEATEGPLDRLDWRQLQGGDPSRSQPTRRPQPAPAFRSYDGLGNNPLHPTWGNAKTPYLRERSGAHYSDGISAPAGADRPGAREISHALSAQGDLVTADEVFESASMAELVPIVDVGGRSVGGGMVGPVVGRLHAALRERMWSLRESALIFNG